MPSLHLINPRCDVPAYFGAEVHAGYGYPDTVLLGDVALPTVAALAPTDFDITISDEGVCPVDLNLSADYIGITGRISRFSPTPTRNAAAFQVEFASNREPLFI